MIDLIAAIGPNLELGLNNALPWPKVKSDMMHFRDYTTGKPVIMGKSTFLSLGKPLPDRTNIVLSSDSVFEGVCNVRSIRDAIQSAQRGTDIVVIGGANVYSQFMEYADRLVITVIEGNWKADTFFPNVFDKWKLLTEVLLEPGVVVNTYVR